MRGPVKLPRSWGRVTSRHCRPRSNHAGRLVEHLFTTRRRVNDGPIEISCSWCGKIKETNDAEPAE